MINFITVPDAMREYDIGEEQLLEIIESGQAAPYDSTRAKLGAEGFEALIAASIEAETSRAERYFSSRAPQPDIWSRTYGAGRMKGTWPPWRGSRPDLMNHAGKSRRE